MGSAAYIEQVIPRPTVYIANLLFFLVVCCQSHLGGGWSEPLESFEGVCGETAFFVFDVTVQESQHKGRKRSG